MTHAPPDDVELADLNSWIDRHIEADFLQHRQRIGQLIGTQMIARSITEYDFLCRVLSIYAETRVLQGSAGTDGVLETSSLDISCGTIDARVFVGITANAGTQIILRGDCADTYAEAMEFFIDVVLDTSTTYQIELLKRLEEDHDSKEDDSDPREEYRGLREDREQQVEGSSSSEVSR